MNSKKPYLLATKLILLTTLLAACEYKGHGYQDRPPRELVVINAMTQEPIPEASVRVYAGSDKSFFIWHKPMRMSRCSLSGERTNNKGKITIPKECTTEGSMEIEVFKEGIGAARFIRGSCSKVSCGKDFNGSQAWYDDTEQVPRGKLSGRKWGDLKFYAKKQIIEEKDVLTLPIMPTADMATPRSIAMNFEEEQRKAIPQKIPEICAEYSEENYWVYHEIPYAREFLVRGINVGTREFNLETISESLIAKYPSQSINVESIENRLAYVFMEKRAGTKQQRKEFGLVLTLNLLELEYVDKVQIKLKGYLPTEPRDLSSFSMLNVLDCRNPQSLKVKH